MHKILMEARERFLNIYANLPLNLRNEIVLVLEGEPLTWNAAYIEVKNSTKKGAKILKKLDEMGFI